MAIDPNETLSPPASSGVRQALGELRLADAGIQLADAPAASASDSSQRDGPSSIVDSGLERARELGARAKSWWEERLEANAPALIPEAQSFGTHHINGTNPDLTALLTYGAILYTFPEGTPEGASAADTQQHEEDFAIAISRARDAITRELGGTDRAEAEKRLNKFTSAYKQAASEGMNPAQSLTAAAESIGITSLAATDFDDEFTKQLEAERARRDAMAAIAGAAEEASPTSASRYAQEEPVGQMTNKVVDAMVDGTKQAIQIAEDAGYPPLSNKGEAFAAWAVWREATWQQNRWNLLSEDGRDPNYIFTDIIHGSVNYSGATMQVGAQAIAGAYEAAKNTEFSKDEWFNSILDKSSAASKALVEAVGSEEAADAFRQAAFDTTARQAYAIANNAGSWIEGNSHRISQYGGLKIKDSDIEFFREHSPAVAAELFDRSNPPQTYRELDAALREPNLTLYAGYINATDQGRGNRIPGNLYNTANGVGATAAFFTANGTKYPLNRDFAKEEMGSLDRFAGQPDFPEPAASASVETTIKGGVGLDPEEIEVSTNLPRNTNTAGIARSNG